jgi:hypothetical protein
VQQAVARSYLHEARIISHRGDPTLQYVQTVFCGRSLTDCGFENTSAKCGLSPASFTLSRRRVRRFAQPRRRQVHHLVIVSAS